jgi:hypothetical protein
VFPHISFAVRSILHKRTGTAPTQAIAKRYTFLMRLLGRFSGSAICVNTQKLEKALLTLNAMCGKM